MIELLYISEFEKGRITCKLETTETITALLVPKYKGYGESTLALTLREKRGWRNVYWISDLFILDSFKCLEVHRRDDVTRILMHGMVYPTYESASILYVAMTEKSHL